MNNIHSNKEVEENNFDCKVCMKTFTRSESLNRQIEAMHKALSSDGKHLILKDQKTDFECTFCKKDFVDSYNFNRHVQRYHFETLADTNNFITNEAITRSFTKK